MDFENYTIGRLVPNRSNYDYEHAGYKATKARILWRIEQLGWFSGNFDQIDRQIVEDQNWGRTDLEPKKSIGMVRNILGLLTSKYQGYYMI